MPMPLTRVELLIDEQEVALGSVWSHSQADPHPGGHRYRLWLPESLARKWQAKTPLDFMLLSFMLSHWQQEHGIRISGPPMFVLNTIDKIAETDQGIEVQGECSPHCSTLKCPCCGTTVWANWLFNHCGRGSGDSLQFTCKDCSGVSNVRLDGEMLTLSSLDGERESNCRQVALKHSFVDGVLRIVLGKLKWELP